MRAPGGEIKAAANPTAGCGWRIGFVHPDGAPPQPLSRRLRAARGAAGLGFLALAGVLGFPELRVLSLLAAWFGASHLVAAFTAYRGCPELGAIPSLVLRRHVPTVCGPWAKVDRLLERRR